MNTTNKRVRFDEPTHPPTDMPKLLTANATLTPKAASTQSVRSFAATLRKHLSPILLEAGLSHIENLHKWNTKCSQLQKMKDDDEFIPRSARLGDFEFRVSKQVEASPEFLEVQAATNILMQDFRLALKSQVMKTLKIEINILTERLYENLARECFKIVQATLISDGKIAQPHVIFSTLINNHWEVLLEHFTVSRDEFCSVYKHVFALAEFPLAQTRHLPADADATTLALTTGPFNDMGQYTQADLNDQEPPGPAPDQTGAIEERDLARSCLDNIFSTIITPHKLYFSREENIEIDITLKKLKKTTETEDAATSAKARLDLEASAPPELVHDLIRGQVAAENRDIKAELGQLKKQLAALSATGTKNKRRGPKKTGGASSSTKKITKKPRATKKTPATIARHPNARKADAAVNATSSAASAKKPKRKPKKNARRS